MRQFGRDVWLAVLVVFAGCATASSPAGDRVEFAPEARVHFVRVNAGEAAPRHELVTAWYARAAQLCGGSSEYEVVSTLVDDRRLFRPGARLDRTNRIVRVPAIRLYRTHVEGYVHCLDAPAKLDAGPALSSIEACKIGDASACVGEANDLRAMGNDVGALALLEEACRWDDAVGCLDAGRAYEIGEIVAADLERAAVLYKRGCKLGADAACEAFARARASANAIAPVDPSR